MNQKNIRVIIALTGVLSVIFAGPVWAQEKFPSRPIQFIIPWAAGGGGTINAQSLQPHFEKAIGGSVQIVNKPGGAGTIAWNFVANSPPDGYTTGIVNPSTVVTLYTTKTGVPLDRFDPIAYTVYIPAGVVVRTESPWKTFREFIDHAKANPGKVQMANSGHAAMYHIGIVGIEMAMGVKFTHVPFKGTGPCITALMGGHVDGSLNEISTLLPYVESKKFRILAVCSPNRSPAVPDAPTFKEFGFDLDVGTWYAYVAAKGTPQDRLKKLQDAFRAGVESNEFKSLYQKQGGMAMFKGPEALVAYFKEQDRLWKKIIEFGEFKPE
ncbi:MAG TPA: tripartite tricarboxylate transporter substrate binding protein [Thermodesulfobacteriota bacterium]|nr:tripartite tricarboxylate transporter substrate binding protein [Thermodesulfobacteriota bacterium]